MSVVSALRPQSGVTRRVWEIADALTARTGRQARRSDVIEHAASEGIHQGTASKQFNDWRLAYEENARTGFSEAPAAPFHTSLTIGSDGRVLIPAELRRAMKLGADGRVNVELVDGELRLFSPAVALEKLQRYVLGNDQGHGSAVDDLIAQRRAEAASE